MIALYGSVQDTFLNSFNICITDTTLQFFPAEMTLFSLVNELELV